eukprot:TRINITY_DN9958_c0_g1_i2.p1 TRINITY_DN9958_c0_g1~~TRINITY_DN9958_c0_g1_i2.p1  ORF type:complete len:962 (+),score=166.47 TRINITY_DN9958_c0_g1_i2:343-3228(+)
MANQDFYGIVRPSSIPQKSYLEGFLALFQRATPDKSRASSDSREDVLWIRFQELPNDHNDEYGFNQYYIVGYASGIQVWLLNQAGEAHQVASVYASHVVTAALAGPCAVESTTINSAARPLLAYAVWMKQSNHYMLKLWSLTEGSLPDDYRLDSKPLAISCNSHVVAVMLRDRIILLGAHDLQPCRNAQGHIVGDLSDLAHPPSAYRVDAHMALGSRWLAYPCVRFNDQLNAASQGVLEASRMQTAVQMVQQTGQTLYQLGDTGVRKASSMLTGTKARPKPKQTRLPSETADVEEPGVVALWDTKTHRLLTQFKGHLGPINNLEFDASGSLLAVADVHGHEVHLYHLGLSNLGQQPLVPLYTLHRGVTTAVVQNISFAPDSRWVAVSSQRGTVHVFPIHPNGGDISTDTHASTQVSNTSRFLLSAGVSEFQSSKQTETPRIKAKIKLHCAVESASESSRDAGAKAPSTLTPHACMMTCFRPLTTISAQAWAQLPSTPPVSSRSVAAFALLVCSRVGRLAEFQVKSFPLTAISSDQTKLTLMNQAMAAASSSPGSDAVATLASNLMGTVGTLVGGMKDYLAAPTFYHDEPSALGKAPADGLAVSYVASRQWDFTRTAEEEEHRALMPARAKAFLRNPDDESQDLPPDAWQNALETKTSNSPHRRVWMRPQVELKRYVQAAGQSPQTGHDRNDDDDDVDSMAAPMTSPQPSEEDGMSAASEPHEEVSLTLRLMKRARAAIPQQVHPKPPEGYAVSVASTPTSLSTPDPRVLEDMISAISDILPSPAASRTSSSAKPTTSTTTTRRSRPSFASKPTPRLPVTQSARVGSPYGLRHRSNSDGSTPKHAQGGLFDPSSKPASSGASPYGSDGALTTSPQLDMPSSAIDINPTAALASPRPNFQLGTSPDSPISRSPEGGLSSSPSSGLGIILGEVDDTDMHRVHSNVSIDGLAEAFQEDEGMFKMD